MYPITQFYKDRRAIIVLIPNVPIATGYRDTKYCRHEEAALKMRRARMITSLCY